MLTKGLLMFVLKKCHFNEALIIYTINLYQSKIIIMVHYGIMNIKYIIPRIYSENYYDDYDGIDEYNKYQNNLRL